ncbi:hypothetical protein EHQ42_03130, partial [Leptospira levettii]|uniref:hypothetical protein n=1 Tax=Leptospira levettii TaxID=2023178 RepID=UPI0010843ACD
MNKTEQLILFSTIFNQNPVDDSETVFFKNLKHDDMLKDIVVFLNNYEMKKHFNLKIDIIQSLNDHGVDIIITTNQLKIGIQLKSNFDVCSSDFATKLKAQLSDSLAHDLDKLYILLCCDLNEKSTRYKVSSIISQISMYKSNYPVIYSPNICYSYFNISNLIKIEEIN